MGAEVRLEAIVKSYGDVRAVDNISLIIPSGQLVTLLGPSGSGKTTTLMVLAGFIEPDAGEIYINDRRITDVPPNRRELGMVFQQYALFPHMTVFQNIAYPLKMRRIDRSTIGDKVRSALELVQLAHVADRYPRQLSGGQQQRVAFARAVVFEPEVLLMDEPLGALDKNLRKQMQLELRSLQQGLGITTLYVTHDQEEAMVLSDAIWIMRDGAIEQSGPPSELYEKPDNAFIATFLGESNSIEGKLSRSSEDAWTLISAGGLQLPVSNQKENRAGSAAKMMLRPERVRWVEDKPIDVDAEGIVETITYFGERIRYSIRLTGGQLIAMIQLNVPGETSYPIGEKVRVGWNRNDAVIL